jgi:hypothetical protein
MPTIDGDTEPRNIHYGCFGMGERIMLLPIMSIKKRKGG